MEQAENFKKFNDYDAIKTNRECVFLLDDFEYAFCPELAMEKILNLFYDFDTTNTKTKIVFTGNPMNAITTWANRAFGKNAVNVRMNFTTDEAYSYHIGGLEEYLGECLKSSIVSNKNTSNIIFLNETYLIEDNAAVLMDVCRLAGSFNAFGKQTEIKKEIRNPGICGPIRNKQLSRQFSSLNDTEF